MDIYMDGYDICESGPGTVCHLYWCGESLGAYECMVYARIAKELHLLLVRKGDRLTWQDVRRILGAIGGS